MLKKFIFVIVFIMLLTIGLLLCMYLALQKNVRFQGTEITEVAEPAQTQEVNITETVFHETSSAVDEESETSTVMTEPETGPEQEITATTEPPPKNPIATKPQETEHTPAETVVPDIQTPEETVSPVPEDEWGVGRV